MDNKHTPTPWRWQDFGRGPILVSEVSGKSIVMDFIRQGMNGAEPRFGKRTDSMGGIMVPLSKWERSPPDMEFMLRAANDYEADKEALRGVAIMLNTKLAEYENEPWAQRVRAALADVDREERLEEVV